MGFFIGEILAAVVSLAVGIGFLVKAYFFRPEAQGTVRLDDDQYAALLERISVSRIPPISFGTSVGWTITVGFEVRAADLYANVAADIPTNPSRSSTNVGLRVNGVESTALVMGAGATGMFKTVTPIWLGHSNDVLGVQVFTRSP